MMGVCLDQGDSVGVMKKPETLQVRKLWEQQEVLDEHMRMHNQAMEDAQHLHDTARRMHEEMFHGHPIS